MDATFVLIKIVGGSVNNKEKHKNLIFVENETFSVSILNPVDAINIEYETIKY